MILRIPARWHFAAGAERRLARLAGRVRNLGLAARFTLVGASVAVILATGLALFFQDRLSNLLLDQLVTRAAGEIDLGFRPLFTAADFKEPVSPDQIASLAIRLDSPSSRILRSGAGIIRIYLYGRDGTVLYSDVADRRGKPGYPEQDNFDVALGGGIAREVSTLESGENSDLRVSYDRALEVYAPVVVDGKIVGVYEIYQDMAPITTLGPLVWTTVFGGFAFLFMTLLVVVRGTAVQIDRELAERRHLEEQLRQSLKMEAIGQLAGGVAHDFNNLLTVIIGYAEMLRAQAALNKFQREGLDQIVMAGQSAASLTRQLLAFSRRQIIAPRPVNLNQVIAQLSKMLARIIGEDIELSLRLEPNVGIVEADPGQIEQVLLNLATNARDAMSLGGKLTISTANLDLDERNEGQYSGVSPGRFVLLAVRDTGSGIDSRTQAHIFEPFFTTKEVGKGTGLGLAAVHGIVKQSNGSIHVDSAPGKGTTFTILLPRQAGSLAPPETRPMEFNLPSGHETVLLVEDDVQLLELASMVLEGSGYTVLAASGGERALDLASGYSGKIDLLLSDVVMPGLSGRVVAERLAARNPGLKILFISGYTDTVIGVHGVLEEGVNFLHKPFVPAELLNKVRQVLDATKVEPVSSN